MHYLAVSSQNMVKKMVNTPTLSFFHFENYLFQQIDERVSMANKIQRVVRAHYTKVKTPTLSEKSVKKVKKVTLNKESYAALVARVNIEAKILDEIEVKFQKYNAEKKKK